MTASGTKGISIIVLLYKSRMQERIKLFYPFLQVACASVMLVDRQPYFTITPQGTKTEHFKKHVHSKLTYCQTMRKISYIFGYFFQEDWRLVQIQLQPVTCQLKWCFASLPQRVLDKEGKLNANGRGLVDPRPIAILLDKEQSTLSLHLVMRKTPFKQSLSKCHYY